MVSVETIGKIRRAWHVRGKSIRSIAKSMGVSRNTVRKVLRSDVSAPKYRRSDQPHLKLGDFIPELERKLEANKGKKRRDRLSMKRIWRQLADQGCDAATAPSAATRRHGSSAMAAACRVVPLEFEPGEAFQFDWSHERSSPARRFGSGWRTCACATAARATCGRIRRWCSEPGVPGVRGVLPAGHLRQHEDGRRRHLRGADAQVQRPLPGDVRALPRGARLHALNAGWEKGQVESQVRDIRERLFREPPRFSLEDLNDFEESCRRHAREHPHPEEPEMTQEVFACEERRCRSPFRVLSTATARRAGASRRPAWCTSTATGTAPMRGPSGPEVFAYADRVDIRLDGELVGSHPRSFARGRTVYDWLHYLPVLERKPGACGTGRRSGTGRCRKSWRRCGAGSAPSTTAIGRWSRSSQPCPRTGWRRCARPAATRWIRRRGPSFRDGAIPARRQGSSFPSAFANIEPEADCSLYDSLREIPR